MEKLKVKHDHKLTDILKVGIFAIFLLLPFFTWLPSGLYYAFNEHAVTENETIEKYETKQVDFNQQSKNVITQYTDQYGWYGAQTTLVLNNGIFEATPVTNADYPGINSPMIKPIENHIYIISCYFKGADTLHLNFGGYDASIGTNLNINDFNYIEFRLQVTQTSNYGIALFVPTSVYPNISLEFYNKINVFDLTQMFGNGNEPTLSEFRDIYPLDYYEFTLSKLEILDIPTGETTTYTNITNQLVYNWQSMWNSPLYYWTNVSILNTGLTNFCNILGINTTAYITNLITYELIIVTIYIVIDIVLTLFKWLTHMVSSKE